MRRIPLLPVLLVLGTIIASRLSPNFLDVRYLLDSATLYVEAGLIALAMTYVIASGNIDLSVASNVVLTACLAAKLLEKGWSPTSVVAASCCIGLSFGLLNGLLVARLKLPSFLVTLGTMAIMRGAAQALLGASSVKVPKGFTGIDQHIVAGVPIPVWILLAFFVPFVLIFHRTIFGRWIMALGGNEKAAIYSGLPVNGLKVGVFGLNGLMCGVSAVLLISRLGVARHDLARGLELDAITMVVVGGTAISGGNGTISGTVGALLLVMLIKTAMGVAGIKAEYQLVAIGLLLIVSVAVGQAKHQQSNA